MTFFLTLMGVGLAGLVLMALPGLSKRGTHGSHGHFHFHAPKAGPHGGGAHSVGAHTSGGHTVGGHAQGGASSGLMELASQLIPEPRAVLSLLTLYGAAGYVLQAGFHLSHGLALFVALIPALAIELLLVGPLWRFALKFQGKEASPLEWLLAEEATAVTAFSNGRGIVRVTHDGRVVQLSAHLIPEHAGQPVKVGDVLRIEDVDTASERVTVSLNPTPLTRS